MNPNRCQAVRSYGAARGKRCELDGTHTASASFTHHTYRMCYAHAAALNNVHRLEPLLIAPEVVARANALDGALGK